jgi:hypothetical protein
MSSGVSRPTILALAIACVAWGLYAPAVTGDFVWDARAKVLGSDFIHQPGNLVDVLTGRVLTRDVLDNNRPGNLLSLMVDAAIWGKWAPGYHATSITLHAVICALLFLLLLRLLPEGGTWAAFVGALAYAAHPLNCEAVSEVSYREDLLVTVSVLVALFAAMRFMREAGFWRNFLIGVFCCGALLFGVSAKENGAAGPVILAGYWWLWRRGERRGAWLGLVGAGFVVVGGFLAARFALAPAHSMIFTAKAARLGGTFGNTLMIQARIWGMQFTQVILPHDLCADYGAYSLRNFSLGMSVAIVGGGDLRAGVSGVARPGVCAGGDCFLGGAAAGGEPGAAVPADGGPVFLPAAGGAGDDAGARGGCGGTFAAGGAADGVLRGRGVDLHDGGDGAPAGAGVARQPDAVAGYGGGESVLDDGGG